MPRLISWLRPRFSLRLLLVAATAFSLALGLHVRRTQSQRDAVAALRGLSDQSAKVSGVRVKAIYDTEHTRTSIPEWLLEGVGRDHFHSVVALDIGLSGDEAKHGEAFAEAIELMRGLPQLRELRLSGPNPLDLKRVALLEGKIESLSIHSPSFDSPAVNVEEHRPRFDALIEQSKLGIESELKSLAELRSHHPNLSGLDGAHLKGDQLEKTLARRARGYLTQRINEGRFHTNLTDLPGLAELTLIQVSTTYSKDDIAESIFRPISRCRSLKTLRLWSCYVNGRELVHLAEADELEFLSIQNSVPEYHGMGWRVSPTTGEKTPASEGGYYDYTPFRDGSQFPQEVESDKAEKSHQNPTEEEWLKTILPNVEFDSRRMYIS